MIHVIFLSSKKVLELSKLKSFTDNKLNIAQIIGFASERLENWENAGYQCF